jgi:hypothetical protein
MTIRIAGATSLDIEPEYVKYLDFFPEMNEALPPAG